MKNRAMIAIPMALLLAGAGCGGTEAGEPGRESGRNAAESQQPAGSDPQPGADPNLAMPGGDAGASPAGLDADPDRPVSSDGPTGPAPASQGAAAGSDPRPSTSPPSPGASTPSSPGSTGNAGATAPQAEAILARAEEVYTGLRSMEAEFVQSVEVPLLDQSTHSRGTLYHRSPDRFLMRFADPDGDIVLADGRHLWMYYPSVDRRQVMRSSLAAAGGQVDLHREFLSNPTERFNAEHRGTATVDGRVTDIILLTPRTPSGYRQVRLWIDRGESLVRRFEITEENQSVRMLELRSIRRNPQLSDAIFEFTPPEGAQIFEQ